MNSDELSGMPTPPDLRGLAIPFFTEAEWHAAKRVMKDGHTWHDSYAEFVARVAQAEAQLRAQGQPTIRVYVRVEAFVAWCRRNGREVDAQSRSGYAALIAAQQDGADTRE